MHRLISKGGAIWYINLSSVSAVDTKNFEVYLVGDPNPIRVHKIELSLLLRALGVQDV